MNPQQQARSNYDKQTNLNWHRKVDRHPDLAASALAEAYCSHLAEQLKIQPPKIFRFEEANCDVAREVWRTYPEKKDPSTDPLKEPCPFFRWRNPWGRIGPAYFGGYTHRESPVGIMINVCCRGEDLLRAVANECYHIYQDAIYGASWRTTSPTWS